MLKFIYALILTLLPVSELRIGLPVAVLYAIENNVPIMFVFLPVILLNILLIFFVFYFLDNLHKFFMKIGFYKKIFNKYIKRFQKRIDKFVKTYNMMGFLALVLFVGY